MKHLPLVAALLCSVPTSLALAQRTAGADLFMNHCAACHGVDGEGSGPVAASLRVTVPNLRTLTQRNGGAFPEETITAYIDGRKTQAAHGDRVMPVWGDVFRGPEQGVAKSVVRRRIAAIVAFVKTLQYP